LTITARFTGSILTGRQSPSLTARQLARTDLPMLWSEQEAALRQ
jgi:hypothetical protein